MPGLRAWEQMKGAAVRQKPTACSILEPFGAGGFGHHTLRGLGSRRTGCLGIAAGAGHARRSTSQDGKAAKKMPVLPLHPPDSLDRYASTVGAWPSGKASVFGTVYRRFESYRPSQIIRMENVISLQDLGAEV